MAHKYPAIDIIKLYSQCDNDTWNALLAKKLQDEDLHWIEKTINGLQQGIVKAANQKLTDDKINHTFIRWQRSLEMTAKAIFKKKNRNPHWNPMDKANHSAEFIKDKRQLDLEFELWRKRISF